MLANKRARRQYAEITSAKRSLFHSNRITNANFIGVSPGQTILPPPRTGARGASDAHDVYTAEASKRIHVAFREHSKNASKVFDQFKMAFALVPDPK
jgi:hypothetical protein